MERFLDKTGRVGLKHLKNFVNFSFHRSDKEKWIAPIRGEE